MTAFRVAGAPAKCRVFRSETGEDNLQRRLTELEDGGWEIVSVVTHHGSPVTAASSGGAVYGFLIVARSAP